MTIRKKTREMSPLRKDEIGQAFEVVRSCSLFRDDGEKMRQKVLEIRKMYDISLMKKKQQSHITEFFKFSFYNHGYNIMRIFYVLPKFPVTTSETKPDY